MAPSKSSSDTRPLALAEERSGPPTEEEEGDLGGDASDDSLTTPRPGPADPALRTAANLSTSAIQVQSTTSTAARPGFDTGIFQHEPSNRGRESQTSGLSFGTSPRRTTEQQLNTDASGGRNVISPRPASSKSVSFSSGTSIPRTDRQEAYTRYGGRGSMQQDGESSSADESTAIMKKNQNASKYGATAEVEEQQGTQDESVINGDDGSIAAPSTVKRKQSSVSRGRASTKGQTRKQSQQQQQSEDDEQEDEEGHDTWWSRFVEKYGSIELENKGSVARDHLALERTFLAWLRTSLSFASIGIAVTQLFRLNSSLAGVKDPKNGATLSFPDAASQILYETFLREQQEKRETAAADTHRLRHVGKPLGATFLGIAILILLLGFHRYFESQHYVIRGKFPASRGTILIVSFVATALICASLVVVLLVAPSVAKT